MAGQLSNLIRKGRWDCATRRRCDEWWWQASRVSSLVALHNAFQMYHCAYMALEQSIYGSMANTFSPCAMHGCQEVAGICEDPWAIKNKKKNLLECYTACALHFLFVRESRRCTLYFLYSHQPEGKKFKRERENGPCSHFLYRLHKWVHSIINKKPCPTPQTFRYKWWSCTCRVLDLYLV